jgi:hypothetical protein
LGVDERSWSKQETEGIPAQKQFLVSRWHMFQGTQVHMLLQPIKLLSTIAEVIPKQKYAVFTELGFPLFMHPVHTKTML